MKAYLTLTLDEARTIAAVPEKWMACWVEAHVMIDEARDDCRWDKYAPVSRFQPVLLGPTHLIMTFVHWGVNVPKIKACRGQCICVLSPNHDRKPAFHYGPPINDTEPMLYAMKVGALLASVRQPKGAKR